MDELREKIADILLQVFNDGFVLGEIGVGSDQESTEKALAEILALLPDEEEIRKQELERILDVIDELSNDSEFFLTTQEIRQALKGE